MTISVLTAGLAIGASYALVAVGLALILGTMNILNLAHGAIAMVGAYAAYQVTSMVAGPEHSLAYFALAMLVATSVGSALGVLLEFGLFHRLADDPVAIIVATLAFAAILDGGVAMVYGTEGLSFDTVIQGGFRIAGTQVSWGAAVNIIVASVLLGALAFLLSRSRLGLLIKASAQDSVGARLCGVNTAAIRLTVTLAASALAALAGTLIATNIMVVVPALGTTYLVPALVAVVVGGGGSVAGAAVVSFALGILEAAFAVHGQAGVSNIVIFGLLFVFLVLKPEGVFGGVRGVAERV